MAKFTLNVSDPKAKTTRHVPLEGVRAQPLVGKSIGESVDGRLLNIGTVMLKITGGTDKDGIPMRWDIQGTAKKRALLTKGVGFKSKIEGERRRKLVRGRVVGEETMQINSLVVEGQLALPESAATEPAEGEAKKEEKPKGSAKKGEAKK
jgi:small subunit ribosomal protein S6e